MHPNLSTQVHNVVVSSLLWSRTSIRSDCCWIKNVWKNKHLRTNVVFHVDDVYGRLCWLWSIHCWLNRRWVCSVNIKPQRFVFWLQRSIVQQATHPEYEKELVKHAHQLAKDSWQFRQGSHTVRGSSEIKLLLFLRDENPFHLRQVSWSQSCRMSFQHLHWQHEGAFSCVSCSVQMFGRQVARLQRHFVTLSPPNRRQGRKGGTDYPRRLTQQRSPQIAALKLRDLGAEHCWNLSAKFKISVGRGQGVCSSPPPPPSIFSDHHSVWSLLPQPFTSV